MKRSARQRYMKSKVDENQSRQLKKVSKSYSLTMKKSQKDDHHPFPCDRIGKKRSDLRCRTQDGQEWASPLEAKVYFSLLEQGYHVRRADFHDSLTYTTMVKQGRCKTCGACEIVQDRTYTPDLVVDKSTLLEIKGYFTGPKRNLFRAMRLSNPSADIRLIVQRDHPVTKGKTNLSDWAKRFRIPFSVWNGSIPPRS